MHKVLLTMRASFVQKITKIEKSVPGGKVLDESLKTKKSYVFNQ